MTGLEIGLLVAQIAVDAAAIALSVFTFGLAAPVASAMSMGFHALSASLPTIATLATGNLSPTAILSSIGSGIISAIPGGSVASAANKAATKAVSTLQKTAPKIAKAVNLFNKKLNTVNKFLDSITPDALLDKATSKLVKTTNKQTLVEDAQIIARKEAELKTFGEVRTDKKISSTTYNKNTSSWIKMAHFEETKFVNRNNIIGTLTIFYYLDNDSRLYKRKRVDNGNESLRAVQIRDCRYKNEYVSGICRAKSWGAYYMRTWMIGKPGRAPGINTLIFFGGQWRVDKKIKNLMNSWLNADKALINHSEKVAKYFLGKTKIGTKLLSFNDAYNKTTSLLGGNTKVLNPYLKKGLTKIKNRGIK